MTVMRVLGIGGGGGGRHVIAAAIVSFVLSVSAVGSTPLLGFLHRIGLLAHLQRGDERDGPAYPWILHCCCVVTLLWCVVTHCVVTSGVITRCVVTSGVVTSCVVTSRGSVIIN